LPQTLQIRVENLRAPTISLKAFDSHLELTSFLLKIKTLSRQLDQKGLGIGAIHNDSFLASQD
jgi:hypothetical protein